MAGFLALEPVSKPPAETRQKGPIGRYCRLLTVNSAAGSPAPDAGMESPPAEPLSLVHSTCSAAF